MRRLLLAAVFPACLLVAAGASPALAAESISLYEVDIRIAPDGAIAVRERITYDFGNEQRHGIFRDIPTRLRYDDTDDRLYLLDVVSVASATAPDGYVIDDAGGGKTRIKIGDPDRTITGAHSYEIRYLVRGALNGFLDHDELYWNAIGADWQVAIDRAHVTVTAPGSITEITCFAGPEGATIACDRQRTEGDAATFAQGALDPYEALTVVVAFPKGTVTPAPTPILEERLTPINALGLSPSVVGLTVLLAVGAIGVVGRLLWSRGRDVRFWGSPVDQVMGGAPGHEQRVPMGEADAEAPVEFAPPEGLRPGQIGTLMDEVANPLDVSATIVDLAVRGHLQIREIPKTWLFGKPDWLLLRLDEPTGDLLRYERALLDGIFLDGGEVKLSDLRSSFVQRLGKVQDALYEDLVARGWFAERPDKARARWRGIAIVSLLAAIGLTFLLATRLRVGLLGVPFVVAGLVFVAGAKRMPARTANGTAVLRRVRGFRRVIETSETHLSRWAEQEQVFTRYLPYAIVFGCTEQWARTFASLATQPDTGWYVSSSPFVAHEFADSIDGFAVTTSGTIVSTPGGSGGSGFGGGGSSGGGGGGGGGGSW